MFLYYTESATSQSYFFIPLFVGHYYEYKISASFYFLFIKMQGKL